MMTTKISEYMQFVLLVSVNENVKSNALRMSATSCNEHCKKLMSK